ncbi:uncharacterized protein LOC142664428 [Rhinoderma darwinii]|uniref:uncharacterized protein LOC142664428 n=1 Tax=Rhinoderma darwinii TaxID=43563 RepID=UPI003F66CA88
MREKAKQNLYITAILTQVQPKHLSTARHLRLTCALLLPEQVTLHRCTTLNPATLLPLEQGGEDVGYAVTTEDVVLEAASLPASRSAQEAELKALAAACQHAEGKTANIYTDSRYAFGIAHDYGPIWRARQFLTSAGTPVKNADFVKYLMETLMLPTEVAVIKIKAHTTANTPEARGNALADEAAKQAAQKLPVLAAVYQIKDPEETRPAVSPELLQKLQGQATEEEKDKWTAQGATLRKDGLWQCQNKLCLPKTMFPMMAQITHGETHQSKTAMMDLVNKVWYAPGFSVMASSFTQGCMICATHNIGRTVKVPQKHTPRPIYPFQRLQIDYIQLPKVGT